MVELSEDLSDINVLLDGIGVIGKRNFENYVQQLYELLHIIEDSGLQINVTKRKRAADSAECFRDFKKEGHTPISKKNQVSLA